MEQPEDTSLDDNAVDKPIRIDNPEDHDGPIIAEAEGATKPDRSVSHLTNILRNVQHGDSLKLTVGTDDVLVQITGEVAGLKGNNSDRTPHANWEYTVELIGQEGDDMQKRLYRMGIGDGEYKPWRVYSYEYYPKLGTVDKTDEVWHGWVAEAQKLPRGWD